MKGQPWVWPSNIGDECPKNQQVLGKSVWWMVDEVAEEIISKWAYSLGIIVARNGDTWLINSENSVIPSHEHRIKKAKMWAHDV